MVAVTDWEIDLAARETRASDDDPASAMLAMADTLMRAGYAYRDREKYPLDTYGRPAVTGVFQSLREVKERINMLYAELVELHK